MTKLIWSLKPAPSMNPLETARGGCSINQLYENMYIHVLYIRCTVSGCFINTHKILDQYLNFVSLIVDNSLQELSVFENSIACFNTSTQLFTSTTIIQVTLLQYTTSAYSVEEYLETRKKTLYHSATLHVHVHVVEQALLRRYAFKNNTIVYC